MTELPDDPIIACIERTGYPPWFLDKHGNVMGEEDYVPDEDEE